MNGCAVSHCGHSTHLIDLPIAPIQVKVNTAYNGLRLRAYRRNTKNKPSGEINNRDFAQPASART
jgi:hypothetical protein